MIDTILESYLDLILKPLFFLPLGVQLFFGFVTSFFELFIIGKLLRWLWDILPFA